MGRRTNSSSKTRNKNKIQLRLPQHLLRSKVHPKRAIRPLNQRAPLSYGLIPPGPLWQRPQTQRPQTQRPQRPKKQRRSITLKPRPLPEQRRQRNQSNNPQQTLGRPMPRRPLLKLMHQPTTSVQRTRLLYRSPSRCPLWPRLGLSLPVCCFGSR